MTSTTLSFFSINRFDGPAEIFASTGFYFDKNQRVALASDNIVLTSAAAAIIAMEDLVTVTLQIPARQRPLSRRER